MDEWDEGSNSELKKVELDVDGIKEIRTKEKQRRQVVWLVDVQVDEEHHRPPSSPSSHAVQVNPARWFCDVITKVLYWRDRKSVV